MADFDQIILLRRPKIWDNHKAKWLDFWICASYKVDAQFELELSKNINNIQNGGYLKLRSKK